MLAILLGHSTGADPRRRSGVFGCSRVRLFGHAFAMYPLAPMSDVSCRCVHCGELQMCIGGLSMGCVAHVHANCRACVRARVRVPCRALLENEMRLSQKTNLFFFERLCERAPRH